ncbi:MAG: hypothetical protein WCD03_07385, partial [Candidatus Cybelea sp.]
RLKSALKGGSFDRRDWASGGQSQPGVSQKSNPDPTVERRLSRGGFGRGPRYDASNPVGANAKLIILLAPFQIRLILV